ncbi:MAG: M4 family metallopeptidase [Aphanothece sp. CMT-3BRIN-NPC111]|nr:M4 family metallopeptidase [Aphanothece sp. CMT-3BRIN-NPC111]
MAAPNALAQRVGEPPSAAPEGSGAVVKKHKNGKTTLVGSDGPQGLALPGNLPNRPGNAEERSRSFLRVYGPSFGIDNPQAQLALKKSFKADGQDTLKHQQVYNNVPVFSGELNVNLDEQGNLLSISGKTAPGLSLSTAAKVPASQARQTALRAVQKKYKLNPSDLNATTPELTIYVPELIGPKTGQPKLVWRVDVTPNTLDPIQQIVLVDAQAPNKVVITWNNLPNARTRQTYTTRNSQTLPGTLVCGESNTTCSNGDTDAKNAHIYAGDTYDFYKNNFGRDSLNGAGSSLISTVHYGTNYKNAFWNGRQMVYGDGLSVADDVVGHELTHGLTQYTSNLNYYYQAGAINESMSDLFGEFIDLTNGKGNDAATVRWQLGEDIPVSVFGGPIRDMKNPPLLQQPDKMTSSYYDFDQNFEDNGGVHTNSGINNKAVYLMTDGGSFNGKTITGIGITKVAKIYYKAQTSLLTSGSDYFDLYNYVNQSCRSLIGTAGITAANCTQVLNATLAVEMDREPYAGYQPEASVCPVGKNPKDAFFDNMEASTNWQFTNLRGSNPWIFYTDPDNPYDKKSLAVDDVDGPTDSVAAMKTGVTIPSGAFLHFKHAFSLEPGYDGGVVEYSIGTSNTWTDARPLFQAGQNYNGTISTSDGSPIAGRAAFTSTYPGGNYVSTRYNLASLAGKAVRFRFREANDPIVGDYGWVIDNVRIYTCQ